MISRTFPRSLVPCTFVLLLAACPASPGGQTGEEGSTGTIELTSGPTTASMTTAVDSSTGVMTTDGSSDSGSTGTGSTGPVDTSEDTAPPPECRDDADCDDGSFCNGPETCTDGACSRGLAPDCADAVDCTVDSCDDAEGACVNAPDDSVCGCAETCDETLGCGNHCVPATCNGQIYLCGNCIDDDGDCGVDSLDSDCWGPCHNNESGWSGEVPGQQNQSECTAMDCYFDQNSGSGNDGCYWSHGCDPLQPTGCVFDPATNIPGTSSSCEELQMMQSMVCLDYCGPLVPNGCDCFGCCEVQTALGLETVYLGTYDDAGNGTCNLGVVDDPVACDRCTQVEACLNTCEMCELCIGQEELPPECEEQECPPPLLTCGLPGQDPCPEGQACVTGCCVPNPQ
jgi:hypothetical protein